MALAWTAAGRSRVRVFSSRRAVSKIWRRSDPSCDASSQRGIRPYPPRGVLRPSLIILCRVIVYPTTTSARAGRLPWMEQESIRVTRSVLLPVSEITIRVSRSSGPGGQHAQKSSTRVEAVFDVEASAALSATQKRRVAGRAGTVVRAVAQDERSQLRNRELAVERLVEKLRAALAVPRRRVPTRPGAAARERRLAEKKRRSRTKELRQRPGEE